MGSVFEDLVERFFYEPPRQKEPNAAAWIPRADISDEASEVTIDVELPGIGREDVKVELKNSILTISGERRSERNRELSESTRVERHYGRFERSFALPDTVDEDRISATYQGGVLTIHLPKTKKEAFTEVAVGIRE